MAKRLAKRGAVRETASKGYDPASEIAPVEPMPPKDPPVGDVGSVASAPAATGGAKRPEWRKVVWWGFGIVVLLLLLGSMCSSGGHGHGMRAMRVVGRLVWSGSEEPVAGARVLAVPHLDLGDDDWDPDEAWHTAEAINEERAAQISDGEEVDLHWSVFPYMGTGARSGADGGIEILTGVGTTTYFQGVFWWTTVGEPRNMVAALWIAPEGKEPVLVRLEEGQFREHEEGEEPSVWGTYDIGTVVVPVGEPTRR